MLHVKTRHRNPGPRLSAAAPWPATLRRGLLPGEADHRPSPRGASPQPCQLAELQRPSPTSWGQEFLPGRRELGLQPSCSTQERPHSRNLIGGGRSCQAASKINEKVGVNTTRALSAQVGRSLRSGALRGSAHTANVPLWRCRGLRANEFKGTGEGLEKNASTWMASEEAFIYSNHISDLPSVITLTRSRAHTKPLGAG